MKYILELQRRLFFLRLSNVIPNTFPCRLSKELQQKDQIIESLHNKLQHRPETPSSCQALSETTDPSDRTSLVSDECQTNEDLDLCSELDARDYQDQEEQRQSEPDGNWTFSHSVIFLLSLPLCSCPSSSITVF